ncbi:MAG: tRNA/rRNA methyltransferase [Pseudomonadales bacterium]
MSISIVLVEPVRAVNVGAAARAMKTMGFEQLILVSSQLHLSEEAHWVAHGSTDVLDTTVCIESVTELRSQFDLLIGCTARERGHSRTYLNADELNTRLRKRQQNQRVALVFGRESTGLTNEELNCCDLFSYIPMAGDYPSMNLGQAVMVYCYALSALDTSLGAQPQAAMAGQMHALQDKAGDLLNKLVSPPDEKLLQWLEDGIALLGERDIKMAHQLLNDVVKKLKVS